MMCTYGEHVVVSFRIFGWPWWEIYVTHVTAKEFPCGDDDVISEVNFLEVSFLEVEVFLTHITLFYGKVLVRGILVRADTWS